MKNLIKTLPLIFVLAVSVLACSKEELPAPIDGDTTVIEGGATVNQFETYKGDIGLIISGRQIAKKGYVPVKAVVSFSAAGEDFTQTINLDENSFMGQIKLVVEELSEAALTKLKEGVDIQVTLLDENDNSIVSNDNLGGTINLTANPIVREVRGASLPEINNELMLKEGIPYLLQRVEEDGTLINSALKTGNNQVQGQTLMTSGAISDANEAKSEVSFVPIPGEPNWFYIKNTASGRFMYYRQTFPAPVNGFTHEAIQLSSATTVAEVEAFGNAISFKIELFKVDDGVYQLRSFSGKPVRVAVGVGLTFSDAVVIPGNPISAVTSDPVFFRIVSTKIDWQVDNIGTSYLEPVLPEAKTTFSFNSTINNCGSGEVRQKIGTAFGEDRVTNVSWSNTLGVTTTNSVNVSATVGVQFDAKFFGTGASYNASLTAGYSWEQSVMNETTNTTGSEIADYEEYFFEREIDVLAKTGVIAYDAYQYYDDVKVSFVQRLRVRGTDQDTGELLSGEEIKSQFQVQKFDGVITKVESNSIVITLRGTVIMDRILKTTSDIEEININCQ